MCVHFAPDQGGGVRFPSDELLIHAWFYGTGRGIGRSLSVLKGLRMNNDNGIKDPDHDLESPASVPTESRPSHHQPGGPNTLGNDRARLHQDPEGQQGGTEGGSQGKPLATKAERTTGTLHLHRGDI